IGDGKLHPDGLLHRQMRGGRSQEALTSTSIDPEPDAMAETDARHDVIVIGAGIAGLVAPNRAAQLGKRVVVLEKSADERYLCNSRYTYGTFHINYTDVGADEDLAEAAFLPLEERNCRRCDCGHPRSPNEGLEGSHRFFSRWRSS